MDIINNIFFQFVVEIIIFMVLVLIVGAIYNKIKNNHNRLLNMNEYLPEEEIHSLRQIFFLIMMGLFFVDVLYSLISTGGNEIIYFIIFDIIISLYLAVTLEKNSLKDYVLLLLLVPYGALTNILWGNSLLGYIEIIHVLVFLYFIKVYYDKFKEYTDSNGLGITIILLFALVFISFLITQVVEGVNPLDSLVMVSNAFTSNGYAVLGGSIAGKLNAIVLVWGGYILSGVGTATLTAAILMAHFNKRFDELEELIKKDNED